MAGIVQYLVNENEEGYRCGYCNGTSSSYNNGMWAHYLTAQNYQDLIDRGWRRSGRFCYKPCMQKICCPQYTIRCDALAFKPSKSHKKLLKRVHRFLQNGKQNSEQDAMNNEGESESGECGHADLNSKSRTQMDQVMNCEAIKDCRDSTKQSSSIDEQKISKAANEHSDDKAQQSGFQRSSAPTMKKKEFRRQRWVEKRKASNLPVESEAREVTTEKTLEEWLDFPTNGKHKLELRLVRTAPYSEEAKKSEDESHAVYTAYQMKVHGDKREKCKKSQWQNFLVDSPLMSSEDPLLGSFHQQYWLDDRLIAVGVLDLLPSCISSVYLYYDPDYSFLSLGTLASLIEIKLVRDLHRKLSSLKYYYMGFYIHSCPKMRYKGKLSQSYLLCPEAYTWHSIDKCLPLLDASKYSRLEPDKSRIDPDFHKSINNASLLYRENGITLRQYLSQKHVTPSELEEIQEYCRLVGSKITEDVYLFRR